MKKINKTISGACLALAVSSASAADWRLLNDQSGVSFVTVKKDTVAEVQTFDNFAASIDGYRATMVLDSSSVNTRFDIRDQRIEDWVLKTGLLPNIVVDIAIPESLVSDLAPGQVKQAVLSASVQLGGTSQLVPVDLHLVQTDTNTLLVNSRQPLVIDTNRFNLAAGVEQLRTAAGLDVITQTVPVSFNLAFDRQTEKQSVESRVLLDIGNESPKAPSQLLVNVSGNTVDLAWSDQNNELDYYLISARQSEGEWSILDKVPADSSAYQFEGEKVGEWSLAVQAVAKGRISPFSSPATFELTNDADDGSSQDPSTPSMAELEEPELVWAINAGGKAYTSVEGINYIADRHFVDGHTYSDGGSISGTEDDALYQSERFGNFSYQLPVENGHYDVIVQLAEIYHGSHEKNKRVFDVFAEGQVVLDDIDILSAVNAKTAHDIVLSDVEVLDGRLDLEFTTISDQAKVSALRVLTVAKEQEVDRTPPVMATPEDDEMQNENDSSTLAKGVLHQIWTDTSSLADLKQFISDEKDPDDQRVYQSTESDQKIGDRYVSRMLTQITIPQTGKYRFYIASDDNGELYLSGSGKSKTKIASVGQWTEPKNWTREPSQKSAEFDLIAGDVYELEALHQEGSGGDHLAIGWSFNDGEVDVISGDILKYDPNVFDEINDVLNVSINKNVLQTKCIACHNPDGPAQNTALVYQFGNTEEVMDFNETLLANFMITVENGAQRVLDKAQGKLQHGGGMVLDSGSTQFELLNQFAGFFDGDALQDGGKTEVGSHHVDFQSLGERCEVSKVGPPMLRRLTRDELIATVKSVFPQLGDSWNPKSLSADSKTEKGFDTDADMIEASVGFIDEWTITTEATATLLVEGDALSQISTCVNNIDCIEERIVTMMSELTRRPAEQETISKMLDLWSIVEAETDQREAWKWTITAMLQQPSVLYRSEVGEFNGSEYVLSNYELADQLAYTYTGKPADETLMALAEAGELSDPEIRMEQAARLIQTAAGRETMVRFVRVWMKLDQGENYAKDRVQNFSGLSRLMTEEAMRLAELVLFEQNGSVADLLTYNQTVINPELADHYGVSHPTGSGWATVNQQLMKQAGILGTGAVLAGNAQSDKSSPTQRGLLVYERLLCQDVPPPPDEIPSVDVPAGLELTTREMWEQFHTNDARCSVCHDKFDPMGFAFEDFDELGIYRSSEFGKMIDASGAITGRDSDLPVNGLVSLAQGLTQDERVSACATGFLNHWAFGGAGGQSCLAETSRDAFARGDISLVEYFVRLAGEPHFERRKVH